jgi:hypothetical protein
MGSRCLTLCCLIFLAVPDVGLAAGGALSIEGHLAREATVESMERKILRRGARGASAYRALTEFYVFRVPSEASWESTLGPAFEDALEADRPLESLRSLLMALDDSDVLLAGPDADGVRVDFSLPNERGDGFFALVPPPLLGPDRRLTNLSEPDKLLVLTGLAAGELPRRAVPDIVQLGLHSVPQEWRGGAPRGLKLKEIQDRGAGAWAKYKGRTHTDGEDLERAFESVEKVRSRSTIRAPKMRVWPGGSDDDQGLSELLRSARYSTRGVELELDLLGQLRAHRDDWTWGERRVKHPTRFGIFTLSVAAERDDGKTFRKVAETLGVVVFYTPFFLDFEEAHLYLQVAPETVASAVQEGQLPFFDAGRSLRFYRGHLDRWLEGRALDYDPSSSFSRREVPRRVQAWASRLDGKPARSFSKVAENPANWPLRMMPAGPGDDSGAEYTVRADEQDLGTWLHRLVSSFSPKRTPYDLAWTLPYEGEARRATITDLFDAPRLRLSKSAGVVAGMPAPPKETSATRAKRAAERERKASSRAAQAERLKAEEEAQRRTTDERPQASDRTRSRASKPKEEPTESRRREAELRSEQAAAEREHENRRAAERRRVREDEEERIAALEELEGDIDIELTSVVLGTPAAGKAYLLTRAGRTLPIKVTYKARGDVAGHKLQIVAQGHDLSGVPMADFVGKSAEIVPKTGEGSVTTYIKVPRNLKRSSQMGSYRVDIGVNIDGVALAAPKSELLRLGSLVKLPVAFLDPAVVTPSDVTELMMNLDLGGWGSSERIPVAVKVAYKVGKLTRSESFTITRRVGLHHLGVSIETPADLPIGEGTYTVTVTAGGVSGTRRGGLLVLDPEMVAQRRGYAGRGRLRIDDPSPEFDALIASIAGSPERREFVRPDVAGDAEGDWDFGDGDDFDSDSEEGEVQRVFDDDFDLDSSEEEIEERELAEARGKQDEQDRLEAKAETERRKKREAAQRKEEARRERARQTDEARQAEIDARAEQDRRALDEEKARAKAASRRAKKEAREKKKRKDLPPEDGDDFDFADLLEDEDLDDEPEPASRRASGGRRSGRDAAPKPEPEDGVLARAESEQLDDEGLPDFVYFIEDEFDVLLAAESEALGVLYIEGTAAKRTLVWLEEWEAAAEDGAPEWLWVIDDGASRSGLRFRRHSSRSGSWKTVLNVPSSFADRGEERAARSTIRRVFRGYVPAAERMISFDKF